MFVQTLCSIFFIWPFPMKLLSGLFLRLMSEMNPLEPGNIPSGVPGYPFMYLRKQSSVSVFIIHLIINIKVQKLACKIIYTTFDFH